MGEVSCDILTADDEEHCVFIRYLNTTNSKITSVNHSHCTDANFKENVTHVLIYKATLPTFPGELGEIFPNLKFIEIFESKIEKIAKEDFKNLTKLEELKLEGNKLRYLPNNLFDYTPNLISVNFAKNQIEKIGANIFDKCKKFSKADFSCNKTINFCYQKDHRNLEELKAILERDCKPLKSLMELAADAVGKNLNLYNYKDVLFIATQLNVQKLKSEVENFL